MLELTHPMRCGGLLAQPGVTSVIIGPRTATQLEESGGRSKYGWMTRR